MSTAIATPLVTGSAQPVRQERSSGVALACAVSVLASAFGAALATVMEHAAISLYGKEFMEASPMGRLLLAIAVTLLVGTTVVVGAIVARQAFTGAVEDRRAEIALRRLLGGSAGEERRRVLGSFARSGVGGAVAGWVIGVVAVFPVEALLVSDHDVFDFARFPPVVPGAVVPSVIVALASVGAAWLATKSVLRVSPLEALRGSSVDAETVGPKRRRPGALVALGVGMLLLAGAVALGAMNPLAVVVGFVGGVVFVSGIVGIAPVVAPRLVALASTVFGRSVPSRVAAGTLATHPGRTSALVLALFVGASIVTMMSTLGQSLSVAIRGYDRDPAMAAALQAELGNITNVVTAIVGFSAVLGVLGFVAAMLLSVRRRVPEIGMLRTLGMRRGDTARMLLAEAGAVTLVAVTTGFVIGAALGWVGAQSMLGSFLGGGSFSIVPSIPWQLPVSLVVAGFAVAVAASWPAGRRAARVSPLEAIAAD